MKHGSGRSDRPTVPENLPNKAGAVEGRGRAKENPQEQNSSRTQSRIGLTQALERIRRAAKKDKKMQFTNLWHPVYDVNRLREAYFGLNPKSAPGIDGPRWSEYGLKLEENLKRLSGKLREGRYRATAVRRHSIKKSDGRMRPIGIPTLEGKILQRATTEVLNAVCEVKFKGYSYGFRPGWSQHKALDAFPIALMKKEPGVRRRHQGVLGHHRPRMDAEVYRAPDQRRQTPAANSQVAQSGSHGGGQSDTERGGAAAGRLYIAAPEQHLPPLRAGPVD